MSDQARRSRPRLSLGTLAVAVALAATVAAAEPPMEAFQADEHTLLLYHFDEGQGDVATDAGRFGYHGQVRGATWAPGRFGKSLRFNGKSDCVFRDLTPAIADLKQITVECWFAQDNPDGRQFLAGKDVTFHYDLSDGGSTTISIYNEGGAVKNADGLPHQQVGCGIGRPRPGRWHHSAITYDGRRASFFVDGVLVSRLDAAKDFSLGRADLGFWVGCYIGRDYWFSGRIDELQISDCVRYDAAGALKPGERAFAGPAAPAAAARAVRTAQQTGQAQLRLALRKTAGDTASGWVYLKAPARPAVIVGRYDLKAAPRDAAQDLVFEVSDEVGPEGVYMVGLEAVDAGAYTEVTAAALESAGQVRALWSGVLRSRRTFQPPLLVPLTVGAATPAGRPTRLLLAPDGVDRLGGSMVVDAEEPQAKRLTGEGLAEYWFALPAAAAYRVFVQYAAAGRWASDLVIDGRDLHPFNMGTRNRPLGPTAADALWEFQGTVSLAAGAHWLRLQDVPPDIFGIRLEPLDREPAPYSTPWAAYAVPAAGFLAAKADWHPQTQFGNPQDGTLRAAPGDDGGGLAFSVRFANTAPAELAAGDCVRLVRQGEWSLEPFAQWRASFRGTASGHVVSLWLIDAKGDEKLLWRQRDTAAEVQAITAPISFEGNDVFDPAHVVAVAFELDEGNTNPAQVNSWSGTLLGMEFDRREDAVSPEGYAERLAAAQQTLGTVQAKLPKDVPPLTAPAHRPWTQPVVPEAHPLFATTVPPPVTRQTMGYDLHLTGARGVDAGTLDSFHRTYDFGDVCWPHLGILPQRANYPAEADYQKALKELESALIAVRERGLYLFDIWGYVPFDANYPYKVAPEHHEILMRVFGERFLGYDNGEQDGRYIGAYAQQGKATTRREGYADFVTWDEHVCGDSMNYMNATGSLNFSHYYGERGARMLGLETAQGLPSDTLLFAFLRGAGRQYGRLLYQASSVWNRYGYNVYAQRGTESVRGDGYGQGPAKGASLSLHRRLFFCGWLDGHSVFGTETSQFTADQLASGAPELSPLGQQHLALREWAKAHPDRGVPYTPLAFVLDFNTGWNPPRHLDRGDTFKIWGKFPYERGDTLIDAMFRFVWPGYEDCSYRRNERGFITPTPYGDSFDVLTNRCLPEVLRQYPALMLLGEVEMTTAFIERLAAYVRGGGDVILEARLARALPESLSGLTVGAEGQSGCLTHGLGGKGSAPELPYRFTSLLPSTAVPLLVSETGAPLITVNQVGQGRIIVGAVDAWMGEPLTYVRPELAGIALPSRLLLGVEAVLGTYFDSFSPVTVTPSGLTVKTNVFAADDKRLLVGLINNDLFADWEGEIHLRQGAAVSAREIWRGQDLPAGQTLHLRLPAGEVAILDLSLRP